MGKSSRLGRGDPTFSLHPSGHVRLVTRPSCGRHGGSHEAFGRKEHDAARALIGWRPSAEVMTRPLDHRGRDHRCASPQETQTCCQRCMQRRRGLCVDVIVAPRKDAYVVASHLVVDLRAVDEEWLEFGCLGPE